jgi:hypothetical protein
MHDDPITYARAQLADARRHAGADARLVAYDINGIQEYVTANSRPRAMRGASALITDFDARARSLPGALFAGGGRGLLLAPAADARRLCGALVADFRQASHVGSVAAASAPYDPAAERRSLQRLRLALDDAKDAADAPADDVPPSKEAQCERCRRYRRVGTRPAGNVTEHLCARCLATTDRGATEDGRGLSLVELVEVGGVARANHVAAISADGNNLGALFAALDSLESTVAVSLAVSHLFAAAHKAALGACGCGASYVDAVTGGDDLRVFLAPWHALPYAKRLAEEVAARADAADAALAPVLPAGARLRGLGVGIGVLAADVKSPASRMIERAHDLELAAKAHCLRTKERSAIACAWSTTDDAFRAAAHDPRVTAYALGPAWDDAVARARALAAVPSAQHAVLAERRTMAPDEFANLFRYQVARSDAWQGWYDAVGASWRDPAALMERAPSLDDLALLRFLRDPEGR